MKENESKEDREHVVKSYIKYSLNVSIKESGYDRIHQMGPKIKKNAQTFQQIIVKF